MRPSDNRTPDPGSDRRPWEAPSLKAVGTVAEILQGGQGKLSILAADSGDIHKPKGQS